MYSVFTEKFVVLKKGHRRASLLHPGWVLALCRPKINNSTGRLQANNLSFIPFKRRGTIVLPYYYQLLFNVSLYKTNQRTDSPESRLVGNGLEVFTFFCSNLLKAFKIQNNLTIRQYYMQAYFWVVILKLKISVLNFTLKKCGGN